MSTRVGAQRGYVATCSCVIDYGVYADTEELDPLTKWRQATITAETIVETCDAHAVIISPTMLHDTVAAESMVLAKARSVCCPPGSQPRILDWSVLAGREIAITVGHFSGDDPTDWAAVQAYLDGLAGCIPTYVEFD